MAGDPAASFGVLTEPTTSETPLAYFVDCRRVEADQVQHRKANVDANVKRGLPLLYPVRKNLRRAEKLLRNMSTVAEIPIGYRPDSQAPLRHALRGAAVRRQSKPTPA